VTGARIAAVADYRPRRVVTNEEVARDLDTTAEWMRTRTGIVTRRIAAADESVIDMAAASGAKALATSGISADAVDLVLLASCSQPRQVPGGSAAVAARLGATNAGAVDINAACAGFCYALSFAADAVRAGTARTVVVAASERMSDLMDWTDRGTCILFGDGAGAAVVTASEVDGIGLMASGSDGTGAELIAVPDGAELLTMDGPAVFRWATSAMPAVARRACELAGIEPSDLAAFVPHQANLRIIEPLARAVGATNAVIARDVVDSGNTSAASIPMALARLVAEGEVHSGDPALLLGFGAGLTYAGQVVRCP